MTYRSQEQNTKEGNVALLLNAMELSLSFKNTQRSEV